MSNNNWSFDKIVALIGLLVAIVTLIVSVILPEVRHCIGFKENSVPPTPAVPAPSLPRSAALPVQTGPIKPAAPQTPTPKSSVPKQLSAAKEKLPFSYVLQENDPQFVELADAFLSFSVTTFKNKPIISLHIIPTGSESSDYDIWTGDSAKFSSSAGDFLVSILGVNLYAKHIVVQVSKAR